MLAEEVLELAAFDDPQPVVADGECLGFRPTQAVVTSSPDVARFSSTDLARVPTSALPTPPRELPSSGRRRRSRRAAQAPGHAASRRPIGRPRQRRSSARGSGSSLSAGRCSNGDPGASGRPCGPGPPAAGQRRSRSPSGSCGRSPAALPRPPWSAWRQPFGGRADWPAGRSARPPPPPGCWPAPGTAAARSGRSQVSSPSQQRMVKRRRHYLGGAPAQRTYPHPLDIAVLAVAARAAAVTGRLPHRDEARCGIAGARVSGRVGESLHRDDPVPVNGQVVAA